MKRQLSLVIAILLASVNYSDAQSRINFGLQFSPGAALQHRTTKPSPQIGMRPHLGFKTGMFIQYNINKDLNVETSLNYTLLKNGTISKTEDKNARYKFGMYHSGAQLALMLNYQTDFNENLIIKTGLGSSVNYMKKKDFYFEDLDYSNSISVKRNWNYQINTSIGLMKKESKFYFGLQLDLGLFVNYAENIQIENQYATYWVKSSSAFFVIKYYLH